MFNLLWVSFLLIVAEHFLNSYRKVFLSPSYRSRSKLKGHKENSDCGLLTVDPPFSSLNNFLNYAGHVAGQQKVHIFQASLKLCGPYNYIFVSGIWVARRDVINFQVMPSCPFFSFSHQWWWWTIFNHRDQTNTSGDGRATRQKEPGLLNDFMDYSHPPSWDHLPN